MTLLSVAARNASLDDDYGLGHGAEAPENHTLHLFSSDPNLAIADGGAPEDVEVTGGGYVPVNVGPADFAAAVGGAKTLNAAAQFPDATEAWGLITHFAFKGVEDGQWWDGGPLATATYVSAAGTGPAVLPVIYYDDNLLDNS